MRGAVDQLGPRVHRVTAVILDEAHELDGEQLAAILPMLATRP